jgi:hypothetical protein
VNKKRKLLNGSEVDSLSEPISLVIYTKCPEKWKVIDMETGEEYFGSNTVHPKFSKALKEKMENFVIGSWRKIK